MEPKEVEKSEEIERELEDDPAGYFHDAFGYNVREILENGRYGLLAKVMDINDLAEKMINLANNAPLLEDLSKFSTKRAEHFDIKKSLKEWINLIENEIKLSGNLNHSEN